MNKKQVVNGLLACLLILTGIIVVIPLVSIFLHSMENRQYGNTETLSRIFYLPFPITFLQYYQALILDRETLSYFWNSVWITVPSLLLGTLISLPSGYALAKFNFPCKRLLFFLYVLVMLLPVQVGIVGTYIFFDKIRLLDSFAGIVLPTVFAPFGSFLIYQFIKAIPDHTMECARLDGAGELMIFLKVVLPQAKAGVASMVILMLIDIWNLVEMPMLLLREKQMQPMSVMLRYVNIGESATVFASIVIFTVPLLLVFSLFADSLSEGIAYSIPVKR